MELQKKEFEIAAVKSRADEILKHHGDDSPGYKELKKQKRRLGSSCLIPPSCMYVCMYESIYNAPLLQPKQSRVRARRPNRKDVSLACCRIMSV